MARQSIEAAEAQKHEPWCHKIAGCSSPGHCTCDADMEHPEPTEPTVTDEMRRAVFEDELRYRLLPNPVIEYLNGYLEAMDEDAARKEAGR